MGRMAYLLIAVVLLLFIATVRFHFMPGRFGDRVSIEFVSPWGR